MAATGVDVVGDIAIVRLPALGLSERRKFAKEMMAEVANVRAVYEQKGAVTGEFRLRKLIHLAGERRTSTIHRENGCVYRVDVARCYFSPRLSTERLHVANAVSGGERVLNMFAGVGPFSILIAKRRKARVTSCEVNKLAANLHAENNRLNRVEGLVDVVKADVAEWGSSTRLRFDRVLMPHPSASLEFLPTSIRLARKGAAVHYYRHVLGRDEAEAEEKVRSELAGRLPAGARHEIRKVREVGPRWLEMVAEIRLA